MLDKGGMWILKTRHFKVLVAIAVSFIVLVLFFRAGDNGGPKNESIRKKKNLDVNSLILDPTERTKKTLDVNSLILDPTERTELSTKYDLRPVKSRGATIFVNKQGHVRVPPQNIIDKMEFRDLEELYHRYLESIQTICKHQVHHGSMLDGGYDLCQDEAVAPTFPCIVYSFGVRNDFSFDEQIHKVYGCEVHSFDPANGMKDHQHSENVYFHSMGLGGNNGVINDNWKMRTASTIKMELGHKDKNISIMKIDIEAGEWTALPEMLSSGVLKGVKQLIMEFHSWVDLPPWNVDGRNKQDYRQHLNILRELYEEGFRIFYFKRFPANCCVYQDEFNIERDGCHEVHLMRIAT